MSPTLVFIDEIDAVGSKRYDSNSGGTREIQRTMLELLNQLDGFQLRMHDWKGEWRLGDLQPEKLEEFFGYYTPGEHHFSVERRWPVPAVPEAREAVLAADVPEQLLSELRRLQPLYRYAAWSPDNDHLFSS